MSEYLLLKDKSKCPKCQSKGVRELPGACRNCGIKLFKATDQIINFEADTGWREYWVYTTVNGWMHRTHLLDERGKFIKRKPKALEREYNEPELDSDYGTQEYQNRKIENSRIELKEALKKVKKKPTFKKVYK